MTSQDLAERIADVIREDVESLANVAYLVVTLRKLYEAESRATRQQFFALKFYLDWPLHVHICQDDTRSVFAELEQIVSLATGTALSAAELERVHRIISFARFRDDLRDFLRYRQIPDLTQKQRSWTSFLTAYCALLAETPTPVIVKPAANRQIVRIEIAAPLVTEDTHQLAFDWKLTTCSGDIINVRHQIDPRSLLERTN